MSTSTTADSGAQTDEDDPQRLTSGDEVKNSLWSAYKEFLGFRSPQILHVLAISALVARLVVGQWSFWDLVIPAVILAMWPFQEWLIHVFILHLKPRKVLGVTIDSAVPRDHRLHHQDPWDLRYVFIPMQGLAVSFVFHTLFWFLVMPNAGLALTGLSCMFIGGTLYEWTHYLVHSRYRPRSKHYKHLWKSHRLHHCKNEHYWYGVSMTFADRVLGTAPDHREVESSHTCRTLDG